VWLGPSNHLDQRPYSRSGQLSSGMSDVFHNSIHINTVLLFNQPSRSTQPGHPSVDKWVVLKHAVNLNEGSPLSVASQCKLVLRAIEREGLYF